MIAAIWHTKVLILHSFIKKNLLKSLFFCGFAGKILF